MDIVRCVFGGSVGSLGTVICIGTKDESPRPICAGCG